MRPLILAVDDDAIFREVLTANLAAGEHEILAAGSGEEALDVLATRPVDCVLLDVMMPGLGGHETCRRIRAMPAAKGVPIILLTSLEDRSAMLDGLGAGADDFVPKSSEVDVLQARIDAQLRRRRFEDENRAMREQLLRSELEASEAHRRSQFKSSFLANMSHELRTPLNSILGLSQILLEEEVAGPLLPLQKEYVGHILVSGKHLLQLVEDVLDLSSIEAGRLQVRRQPVGLAAAFQWVEATLQPLADRQGVSLHMHVPDDLPPLLADPLRLRQVLTNLVGNAIKFTPRSGSIDVSAEVVEGRARISVRDTGVGIRSEDLHRLFQEYERIDALADDAPAGTGLGLALTRRLVEAQGGTLEVVSAPGSGSTFTFELPLAEG